MIANAAPAAAAGLVAWFVAMLLFIGLGLALWENSWFHYSRSDPDLYNLHLEHPAATIEELRRMERGEPVEGP